MPNGNSKEVVRPQAKENKEEYFFNSHILDLLEDYESELRKNDARNMANLTIPAYSKSYKPVMVKKIKQGRTLKVSLRMEEPKVHKELTIDTSRFSPKLADFILNLSPLDNGDGPERRGYAVPGICSFNQQAFGAGLNMSPLLSYVVNGKKAEKHELMPNEDVKKWIIKILRHIYIRKEKSNIYEIPYPAYFHRFVKKLKMYRGFLKFLEICSAVSVCLFLNNIAIEKAGEALVEYIVAIENAFHGHKVDYPSGLIFLAPPGMGKTTFSAAYPFGLLDTDWLNDGAIDQDPAIIDRLVENGISIITNRWEFKKWSSFKVGAFPNNLKDTMSRKGFKFEKPELIAALKKKKEEARNKMSKKRDSFSPRRKHPDGRAWIDAYKDVKDNVDLYIEGKNFISCFEEFQLYCLGLKNSVLVRNKPLEPLAVTEKSQLAK